jgi:hypothetical protein
MTRNIIASIVAFGLVAGCASGPQGPGSSTATVPVNTQGAQTVGQNQGTASAAETGSATNNNTPSIYIVNAAKRVTITQGTEGATVEVEGSDDSEVTIGAAYFGVQRFGDEGMQASTSSGGGAAGGTGAATRTSGNRGGSAAGGAVTGPTGN